jgi:hypothetical protein
MWHPGSLWSAAGERSDEGALASDGKAALVLATLVIQSGVALRLPQHSKGIQLGTFPPGAGLSVSLHSMTLRAQEGL